jgi:hypothetical protein
MIESSFWRHAACVLLICALTAVIYAKVTEAYFCAYDDFLVMHQAAFKDHGEPLQIFTTPHWNSPKYRPLNRLVSLWTYDAAHQDPLLYRIRNLTFHLLNIVLLYTLGWLLFRSTAVSMAGAALFAFHPLANQSVIGATWTNTVAHSEFLAALVFFFIALKARRWPAALAFAALLGWGALLTYDPDVTIFPLMAAALAIFAFTPRRGNISGIFIALFCALSGALMTAYLILRALFVPRGWSQAAADIPGIAVMTKNFAMYLLVLLTPLDPVLANQWLKTPLPSEIVIGRSMLIFALATLVALGLGIGFALRYAIKRSAAGLPSVDWSEVVFLLCAIAAPLLPVLLFQPHPSETYMYLSAAFFSLLLAYVGSRAVLLASAQKQLTLYTLGVVALALNFSAATWVRNNRVLQCAQTALRIISSLPGRPSPEAPWKVAFVPVSDSHGYRPYGFYAHRGIYTIGDDDEALTAALQLRYRSESVTGSLIPLEQVGDRCGSGSPQEICLSVYSDGQVETIGRPK